MIMELKGENDDEDKDSDNERNLFDCTLENELPLTINEALLMFDLDIIEYLCTGIFLSECHLEILESVLNKYFTVTKL